NAIARLYAVIKSVTWLGGTPRSPPIGSKIEPSSNSSAPTRNAIKNNAID
ncbi:major facilitator superfamily MFS_1, partial [Vibrio parahaemolyticus V-223/04]